MLSVFHETLTVKFIFKSFMQDGLNYVSFHHKLLKNCICHHSSSQEQEFFENHINTRARAPSAKEKVKQKVLNKKISIRLFSEMMTAVSGSCKNAVAKILLN